MAFCASSSLVMADCGGLRCPRSLALDEYWSSADAENEKREKRERETVKSSGTTGKIPDGSREKFPIDDRLTNGHNEA